ncbi:MAG: septal ring lytic transglycosylase RlpA family protein [Ramlibacter sp.]
MRHNRPHGRLAATIAILSFGLCAATGGEAGTKAEEGQRKPAADRAAHHGKLDRSGRAKVGKASFYARRFAGRKMADGTPMKPHGANAASKTLPLGTVARVTNLETGQSTAVTIQDRGPYVPGRIIDLPPSKAQEIGITHKNGVAPVEVAPIVVPTPDGGVKPGDGARPASR